MPNSSQHNRTDYPQATGETSHRVDQDLAMSDSDGTLPSFANESGPTTNLNQSIGSLRDVEMCEDNNKSISSTPSSSRKQTLHDDDDLYLHPSSSKRNQQGSGENKQDDNEDMASSLRQARKTRDDYTDNDGDEDENDEDYQASHSHEDDDDDDDDEVDEDEEEEEGDEEEEEEEGENPFRTAQSLLQHFQDPFGSMSQIINDMSNRISPCLDAISQREDLTMVMVGLQEIAEIILMTNEESLVESLPTPKFLDILANLMVDPLFEDNVEILLMACRCLCNLLDANPSSLDKHSYTRIVQVLCQKLFEIQYIDIAEQALTVSTMAISNCKKS